MTKIQPLEAGQAAPHFTFSEGGQIVSSRDISGPYLLYFYPKDNTPGCTKQACAIRNTWAKYKNAQLTVVGVSKDSDASHEKFKQKFELPFPLIADTELELSKAYGVYGEKKFMGRTFRGIHRTSFLISKDGIILKTYLKIKPALHAEEVLNDLIALNT